MICTDKDYESKYPLDATVERRLRALTAGRGKTAPRGSIPATCPWAIRCRRAAARSAVPRQSPHCARGAWISPARERWVSLRRPVPVLSSKREAAAVYLQVIRSPQELLRYPASVLHVQGSRFVRSSLSSPASCSAKPVSVGFMSRQSVVCAVKRRPFARWTCTWCLNMPACCP